jgi:DNA modification methylase
MGRLGPFELDTIIVGDCLDVMRQMPDGCVDLVVTDPPYPKLSGGIVLDKSFGVAESKHATVTVGTPWNTSLAWMTEAWRVSALGLMCFCSFHNVCDFGTELEEATPVGLITWYTRNVSGSLRNVPRYDTQFVWLFKKKPGLHWRELTTMMLDIPKLPAGCFASERILVKGTGQAAHPTQKPLKLLSILLKVGGDLVFDPFMGSGTTAVAARQLGRHYFGCDISPEYVEMAQERLKVVQLRMVGI